MLLLEVDGLMFLCRVARRLFGEYLRITLLVAVTACALSVVDAAGAASVSAHSASSSGNSGPSTETAHLACPSTSECLAIDAAGKMFASTNPSKNSRWTATSIPKGYSVSAVACASASVCVAIDNAGDVLTSSRPAGGSWQVGHVAPLADVTCPSANLCVGVGGRAVAVSTDPRAGASSWRVYPDVDQVAGPECGKYAPGEGCDASLTHVSCPSATFCAAVDDWGWVVQSKNPSGGAADWSAKGEATGPALTSMSCVSGTVCVGVCPVGVGLLGSSCPGASYDAGDVVTMSSGATEHAATITATAMTNVWCPRGMCFASDQSGDLMASASPEQGSSTWHLADADTVQGGGYNAIQGVSCPTSSECLAVDHSGDVIAATPTGPSGPRGALARRVVHVRFRRVGRLPVRPQRIGALRPRAHPVPLSQVRWRPSMERGLRGLRLRAGVRSHAIRSPSSAGSAPSGTVLAASTGAGYGIATASSYPTNAQFAYCTVQQVPCPAGDLLGYYQNGSNQFTALRQDLPMGYARFLIPYDVLSYWTPSTGCTTSPAAANGLGVSDFDQLAWEVQAAQADGLTPVVAFTNGTGSAVPGNIVPPVPDLSYGGSAPYAAWTNAGYEYECGVQAIMQSIGLQGLGTNPVKFWEAWNEPNGSPEFNGALYNECGSVPDPCGGDYNTGNYLCGSNYVNCGPLEAAELWESAEYAWKNTLSSDGFSLAALTLSDAGNSTYENAYISQIGDMNACNGKYYCAPNWPTVFSVHDYGDPSSATSGAHSEINSFTSSLYKNYSQLNLTVWITEAAVDLNYYETSDGNRSSGCNDGESDHYNSSSGLWTFGGCVDHNPSAQATGASSFLNLGNYGNGWTISQVDWFEFQAANPSTGFDSGLLSPNTGSYGSPSGLYSQQRQSFCVLEHVSGANCSNSSLDAGDWSTNPGGTGA